MSADRAGADDRVIRTGIPGFDPLVGGGLPRRRTTLVVGGPGCGKTTFALQVLIHVARDGAGGIFVAFEEPVDQIRENLAHRGLSPEGEPPDSLSFVDARVPSTVLRGGDFDLAGLLQGLGERADDLGAGTIVFDALDVLLASLEDSAAERRELYRLHEWLQDSGLTGILTAKETEGGPRYEFLEFMADCVVRLDLRTEGKAAVRGVRILKNRSSGHATHESPMIVTDRGLEIVDTASVALEHRVSDDRVSTGIDELDRMLGGGFYRGSSILVSGSSGTAKTTLAAAFADAACRRGEPTLYVSFDESAPQIVRNLGSVSIDLESHLDSGILHMDSARARPGSPEEHIVRIRSLWREHGVRNLVVDPLSALEKPGTHLAEEVGLYLVDLAKQEGITFLSTCLVEGSDIESTPIGISTVADTWIHLSYLAQAGERNRALTVVKSRGMRHSNQVRELVLADDGLSLREVYTAGGEVLMGTLRWEKEEEERAAREEVRRNAEHRQRQAEIRAAEIRSRLETLQGELEVVEETAERARGEARREQRELRDRRRRIQELRTRGEEADTDRTESEGSDEVREASDA
ncbi:MAG: circadian clock protein KaiC [Thermoanaerobaculia bacterium]|nr:circadian clock protein KaiC [Thermoanaerobaculia bacterium]